MLELPGVLGIVVALAIGFNFNVETIYLMNVVPYGATLNGFMVALVYGTVLPLCIFYRKLLAIATLEELNSVNAQIEQEKRNEKLVHLGERLDADPDQSEEEMPDMFDDSDDEPATPAKGRRRRPTDDETARLAQDNALYRDLFSVLVMLLYFVVVIFIGFRAYPQQPLLDTDLFDWWTFARLFSLFFGGVILFPVTLRNVERSISRRRWENGEHYVWLLISDLRRHVFVVLFAFFFILARSISVPSLLSPVAWNQGDGLWNTTLGEPCAAVSASYVAANCVASSGLRPSAWHFLEETRCHDGGFFSYESAKDACHAARAAYASCSRSSDLWVVPSPSPSLLPALPCLLAHPEVVRSRLRSTGPTFIRLLGRRWRSLSTCLLTCAIANRSSTLACPATWLSPVELQPLCAFE